MTNLGALGGTPSSGAGINDLGQVVGGDASGAFLYSSGTMYDLNDLVTNGLASGAILTEAAAINNQGWIVASDGHSGTTYLLEPTESSVPEPTSTLLTLLGAIAVSISRIRFRRSRSHCGRETQVHPIDGLNI
jgi:probable HAF family extracellular repeat protein